MQQRIAAIALRFNGTGTSETPWVEPPFSHASRVDNSGIGNFIHHNSGLGLTFLRIRSVFL